MVKTEPDGQSVNIPTLPLFSNGETECIRCGALLNLTLLHRRSFPGKSGKLSLMTINCEGKFRRNAENYTERAF